MNRSIMAAICLLLLTACHSRKAVTTGATTGTANDLTQLGTMLERTQPDYKWMRLRARASVSNSQQSFDNISAYIKLRDDSLIWANASLLLPIGRLLVTQDSAVMLNNLQSQYMAYPLSELKNMLAIDGLDLKAVQNLLLAFPPFGIKQDTKWQKEGNDITLTYQNGAYKEIIKLDEKLMRMRSYYYEKNATQYIRITYDNFREAGGMQLPQKVDFEIASPEKNLISLDIKDITLVDTDDAPFSIPASYRKK